MFGATWSRVEPCGAVWSAAIVWLSTTDTLITDVCMGWSRDINTWLQYDVYPRNDALMTMDALTIWYNNWLYTLYKLACVIQINYRFVSFLSLSLVISLHRHTHTREHTHTHTLKCVYVFRNVPIYANTNHIDISTLDKLIHIPVLYTV